MIAYLQGVVGHKGLNELVVDVGGVGYLVNVSAFTLTNVPKVGENIKIYTHFNVRQEGMELYGFLNIEEKEMFLKLTSVTGIGPKSALAILGSMPLKDLSIAIVTGDAVSIARAPGVGKKTASRIVLELKEKVTADDLHFQQDTSVAPALSLQGASLAIEALQSLGYTANEATKAIQKVQHQSDKTDDLIRLALRNMAGM